MPSYKGHPAYYFDGILKSPRYRFDLDGEDPKRGTAEFDDALKAAGVSTTRVAIARMLEFAEENDPTLIDAINEAHHPGAKEEAARMRECFHKFPWQR